MTYQEQDNRAVPAARPFGGRDLDGLGVGVPMGLERVRLLAVVPPDRGAQRDGYANGYKSKTVKSWFGVLGLAMPQIGESSFYRQSLDQSLAPPPHARRRLRTSNNFEVVNRESKRRTRPLVSAVTMEISKDRHTGGAISIRRRTIANRLKYCIKF